ncbi:MAG: T9SS type A sorting domain-containing protein [Bacteroidota bacterium]
MNICIGGRLNEKATIANGLKIYLKNFTKMKNQFIRLCVLPFITTFIIWLPASMHGYAQNAQTVYTITIAGPNGDVVTTGTSGFTLCGTPSQTQACSIGSYTANDLIYRVPSIDYQYCSLQVGRCPNPTLPLLTGPCQDAGLREYICWDNNPLTNNLIPELTNDIHIAGSPIKSFRFETSKLQLGENGSKTLYFVLEQLQADCTPFGPNRKLYFSRPITIKATTPTPCTTPPTPVITALNGTGFCEGGSVELTAPSGFNYLWSTNETTQNITVSSAGSYTVQTITGNCTSAASAAKTVFITPIPAQPTISANGPIEFCNDESVMLSAPPGYTDWIWYSGGIPFKRTSSINIYSAGNFTLQVIAGNCTSEVSNEVVTNLIPTSPTPLISAAGPLSFCAGGSVILSATESDSYIWSTGETTQSIIVAEPGDYWVQVKEGNSCLSYPSNSVTVSNSQSLPAPVITAGSPLSFCVGSSVLLGGPDADSYLWSTGETTQTITVTNAGEYWLKVAESTCESPASDLVTVVVTSPSYAPAEYVSLCPGNTYLWYNSTYTGPGIYHYTEPGNGIACDIVHTLYVDKGSIGGLNGAAIATGSNTPVDVGQPLQLTASSFDGATYSWTGPGYFSSNDQNPNIPDASPVNTGQYILETSVGNCHERDTLNIEIQCHTIVTQPLNVALCEGSTYMFEGMPVNEEGTYITIKDGGLTACDSLKKIKVTILALPETPTVLASGPTIICQGTSVSLSATVAAAYLWSNGATTREITVNRPENYSVQVINTSGCTSAVSGIITVTVVSLPARPFVTASSSLSFCEGGAVSLSAPTATAYLWSNGATTKTITSTVSGSYTVQVINSSGCTSQTSVITTVSVKALPQRPVITATGPTDICEGNALTLNASSSSERVSYIWNNGETTESITTANPGLYQVWAIANGCTSTASEATTVTIKMLPNTPILSVSGNTALCAGNNVTLTSSSLSDNIWSNGATTQNITVDAAGSYGVRTVRTGCTSALSNIIEVTVAMVPPTPIISASSTTTLCVGNTVTLTSSEPQGNLWSNGAVTRSVTVSDSGRYTVRNIINRCTSAASAQVVVYVNPVPSSPIISASGSTSLCAGNSVTLTANSSPFGSETVWSNGSVGSSIVLRVPGTYTAYSVISGCTSLAGNAITVNVNAVPDAPQIQSMGTLNLCERNSVQLKVSNFRIGYNYLWSNSLTDSIITVTEPGSYTAVCIVNGCTSQVSAVQHVTVTPLPTAPHIRLSGSSTFCSGDSLTLMISEHGPYLWNTGDTTQSITVHTGGVFSAVVAGQCTSSSSDPIFVTVNPMPAKPIIISSGNLEFCSGDSVILTAMGSSFNATFEWSNGETTASIVAKTNGIYTLRVSESSCLSMPSEAVTIIAHEAPATPILLATGPTAFCNGRNVIIKVTNSDGPYLWSNGETADSITVRESSLVSAVKISLTCTSALSSPIEVLVLPIPEKPVITLVSGNQLITDSGGSSYVWYLNGEEIPAQVMQTLEATENGSYTVNIISNGCLSSLSEPYVLLPVGKTIRQETSISPNPTNGMVKIAGMSGTTQVVVIDMLGRTLFSTTLTVADSEINLQALPSGVYNIIIGDRMLRLVKL